MSGRIRTIKPELLEDEVTAGLSDMAFRLFISIIVLADDYGRLRAGPAWLMGQIYWARSIQVETFLDALKELEPLILFYEVNGQRYAEIRNWAKHQKVSHPGKPRIPAPSRDPQKSSGDSPKIQESLVPDLRPRITDQGSPTTDQDHDRSVSVGTASAVEARSRFQESVATATGKRFALARAPFHDQALADVVNTHGPPGSIASKLEWLDAVVAEWVKSTDPKFSGGWVPAKLLDWLNAGKPDRESGPRMRPRNIVQPSEGRAWTPPAEMP